MKCFETWLMFCGFSFFFWKVNTRLTLEHRLSLNLWTFREICMINLQNIFLRIFTNEQNWPQQRNNDRCRKQDVLICQISKSIILILSPWNLIYQDEAQLGNRYIRVIISSMPKSGSRAKLTRGNYIPQHWYVIQ